MQIRHTPTPWGFYEAENNYWMERADHTNFTGDLFGVIGKQDVTFIIQAVNERESLIRVMNEAKHYLNTGKGKEFLLQAIAKAEGK